jgi:hypothetical protein
MAFQFQCPQEHLLEGEESQAGQTIHCPVCGMLFIIPEPVAAPAAPEPEKPAEPEKPPEPELLHIPCPNGHELEVPLDMLDTEVLCPQCNVQFRLRAKDSVEHRKKKEQAEALREAKTNKFWYQFSIGTVIVVVLLLVTLIVMSAMSKYEPADRKQPGRKPKSKPTPVESVKEPMEQEEGERMPSDDKSVE